MTDEIEASKPQPAPAQGTPVFYNQSHFFRVIHVTGVYGGPTPVQGELMMTLFNDRVPFPEKTVNDSSGKEILQQRVVRQGIERELEVSLVMNLNTAKIIHEWLANAIDRVEPKR